MLIAGLIVLWITLLVANGFDTISEVLSEVTIEWLPAKKESSLLKEIFSLMHGLYPKIEKHNHWEERSGLLHSRTSLILSPSIFIT